MAEETFNSPRIMQARERVANAKSESEKKKFLMALTKAIVDKLNDITISGIEDGITVDNFDEVTASLRNELSRANKPLMKMLESLNLSTQEQTQVIEGIEAKAETEFKSQFQPILIKRPRDRVEISNIDDIIMPDTMSVSNLQDLKPLFDNLVSAINKALKITLPAPKVNVAAPIVNIPESSIEIPEVDLDPLIKEIRLGLNKLRTNGVTRPLAVRLSDGSKWLKEIVGKMESMSTTLAGFSDRITLVNAQKHAINPATEESVSPPGSIVTGTKTVTTAGTAVRLVTDSTDCRHVWVSSDLGNTGGVLVVGDSSVVAADSSQQGVVIIGGNLPVKIEINNLNKLWVDAQTSGDKLSYAYTI